MTYISDLIRSPQDGPPTLLEAKRRTFSYGLPIYQCDTSMAESKPRAPGAIRFHRPITIDGQTYEKGIGTGTPFIFTLDLNGKYDRFTTVVGIDDFESAPEPWRLEIYLDDIRAGEWVVAPSQSTEIELPITGARDLVLVGHGRDRMMVNLANAQLFESIATPTIAPCSSTNRRFMFEFDDQLIIDGELLLMARSAKKVDARTGPDQSIDSLGGYGRATAARGADIWAGLPHRGDLLRWQVFVRRPGHYRVHTRVVSASPGVAPTPEDYSLHIDGRELPTMLAPHTIVERMPDERFTDHQWGYLVAEITLPYGLHDVELANAGGTFLAANRIVLTCMNELSTEPHTLPAGTLPTTYGIHPGLRWTPHSIGGRHYVGSDNGAPFARARALGLAFAPNLVGVGGDIVNSDPNTVENMLQAALPFSIHSRFAELPDNDSTPIVPNELHERLVREAGDRFLGYSSTEWSDCYVFWSTENSAATTRAEAYEQAQGWYQKHASTRHNFILPMCATWHYDHYAGEWGGVSGFMDEPGIAPEVQLNILFARGAARQYGKPWHSYVAPGAHDAHTWIQNGYFIKNRPYDAQKTPTGGSSIAWIKRMLYLTYMWGTSSLKNESPAYETDMTVDGHTALSPMGEVADEFFAFVATHPDRGVCHTPFGLMLDRMHGWNGHPILPDICPQLTWGCLPLDGSDHMKDAIFQTIYPHQFDAFNEWGQLSPTPYGDIFDVMLSTAPFEHLEDYARLMLIGDVAADMDSALIDRLDRYVHGGGTLVINVAQLGTHFPSELLGVNVTDHRITSNTAVSFNGDWQIDGSQFTLWRVDPREANCLLTTNDGSPLVTQHVVGAGAVVLTTVPFLLQDNLNAICFLPNLLAWLSDGLLPFQVFGDVEFVANRTENAWLLTLLNHRGIYKVPTEREVIDQRQRQRVRIVLRDAPSRVTDWINEATVTVRKDKTGYHFDIDIGPGDLRILKIDD